MAKRMRKGLSLKTWLVLAFVASLLVALPLTALSTQVLGSIQGKWFPSVELKEGEVLSPTDAPVMILKNDGFIRGRIIGGNTPGYHALNLLQSGMPILIFGLCIVAAAALFYRLKLQKPLYVLKNGMEHIARQDLDFTIDYGGGDELGALCEAFDAMRRELNSAFKTLWNVQEQQRRLTQAFAHDLRTPLTVLKGNTDLLALQAENKSLDPEKVLYTADRMQESIARMERYLEAMREMRQMEEWKVLRVPVDLQDFTQRLQASLHVLAQAAGKKLAVNCQSAEEVLLDEMLVLRVLDNLASNALRHARSDVVVDIRVVGSRIVFRVEDDGKGFSQEALHHAFDAFYSGDAARTGQNMGLGMTIARELIRHHGGNIDIGNRIDRGEILGAFVECTLYR